MLRMPSLGACLIAGLLVIAAPTSAAPVYTVTDLGTLAGSTDSYGYGLNNAGDAVGFTVNASGVGAPMVTAFVYKNGVMSSVGDLGGGDSRAYSINDKGQIAGDSKLASGQSRGFIADSNGIQALPTLPGGTSSQTFGINNSGVVVGRADGYPVIYTNGGPINLGTIGVQGGIAYAINDSGQVTGLLGNQAFSYQGGAFTFLSGAVAINPQSINNSGIIIGDAYFGTVVAGNRHAFLYDGTIHDLGTLGGDSLASDVNAHGDVVGEYYVPPSGSFLGAYRPFLYTSADGMVDLISLIAPGSGWTIGDATSINDSGQILAMGSALIDGRAVTHAVLLTPVAESSVPEPSTLALMSIALIGIASLRRRRSH